MDIWKSLLPLLQLSRWMDSGKKYFPSNVSSTILNMFILS